MSQLHRDLKEDLFLAIESSYAEYKDPDAEFVKQNLRGVFKASNDYDMPELESDIVESVEFLFSEDETPSQDVVKSNIEASILSWKLDN